jgi:hypothetical protein
MTGCLIKNKLPYAARREVDTTCTLIILIHIQIKGKNIQLLIII